MPRIVPALALVLLSAPAPGQHQDPNQVLKSAIAAQQSGDLPAAIRDYRALLALRPNSVEAHVNLGAALTRHAEYDAAIQEFQAALPLAPPGQRAGILLDLGLAFYKKGDFAAAQPQFQSVLDLQPASIQAATLLGDCDIKLARPAEALAVLQPRASFAAQTLDFAYVYGLALIRTGSLHQGAQVLQQVADSGNAADVYLLAGQTWIEDNEFEAGRRDLETARKLDPKLPGIDSLVGIARDRNGDPVAAEAAFRDALKLDPNNFEANLYLGAILLKSRQLPEAAILLDRALALRPADPMALYESGMRHSKSGDLEAAVDLLRKASAPDPSWLEPHIELVSLYYKLHRTAEGAAERMIVDKLTADQQAAGTGLKREP